MKKSISIILITIFVVLLISPSIMWFVVGDTKLEKLEEKRELTEFPVEVNNSYFNDIKNWFEDNAPYRSTIISGYKKINQKIETYYRKNIHTKLSLFLKPAWYDKNDYLVPLSDNLAIYGKNDWLFYEGDNSIGYYEGTNILSTDEMKLWKEKFEELNELCKTKDIDLVILTCPNKEQIYPENMPSYNIQTENKRQIIFNDYIAKNSDVNYLYPYENIINIKSKYSPYYQQDTHWNIIGAYIGLTEIYKTLNKDYINIDDLYIDVIDKVGGDLSNMCGFSTKYNNYTIHYKDEVETNIDNYEEGYVSIYSSNTENTNKAVVIGDSFRSALCPYLAKDFKKTYVCHRNYMNDEKITEQIKELKKGDLLLILAVERYDNSHISVIDKTINILLNK